MKTWQASGRRTWLRRRLLTVGVAVAALVAVVLPAAPAQAALSERVCLYIGRQLHCFDIPLPVQRKWPDPPPECMCELTIEFYASLPVEVEKVVIGALGHGLAEWGAAAVGWTASDRWMKAMESYTTAARALGRARLGVYRVGWFDPRAGRFDPSTKPWSPEPEPWLPDAWDIRDPEPLPWEPDPQPWDPQPHPWFGAAVVDLARGVTLIQQSLADPEFAQSYQELARSEFDEAYRELAGQAVIDG